MLDLDRPILTLDEDVTAKLRRWNLAAAGLHFVTGLVIVLIGDRDFGLPVTSFNINGPPGTDPGDRCGDPGPYSSTPAGQGSRRSLGCGCGVWIAPCAPLRHGGA